jgi:hypothetical protein
MDNQEGAGKTRLASKYLPKVALFIQLNGFDSVSLVGGILSAKGNLCHFWMRNPSLKLPPHRV